MGIQGVKFATGIKFSERQVQQKMLTEQIHTQPLSVASKSKYHGHDTEPARQMEHDGAPEPWLPEQSPFPSSGSQYVLHRKSPKRLPKYPETNQPVVMCSQPHRLKVIIVRTVSRADCRISRGVRLSLT